ncbi:MAG: winged helix-turn-helix domain-containing protein, partial [Candidatus Thorarchaeota archaeon]
MNKDFDDKNNINRKNVTTKQKLYKDIILEEDWLDLIDKHELRYEIWAILKLYNELNVTEISHLVKQSKSTVSRVLIRMEKDGMIISRRGVTKEGEGEKIPPKYYRINGKLREKFETEINDLEIPTDPQKLREFFISEIANYRNAIYNIHKLLDFMNPLLKTFEDQLEDINKAKNIYKTYLSGKNEPWFNLLYFDHERYEKFLDIRLEYLLKLEKLAREQELNPENAFVYLDASLPLKAIFELKKNKIFK